MKQFQVFRLLSPVLWVIVIAATGNAQVNSSQEKAEAEALKKYESTKTTSLPVLPPPAPALNEAFFGAHIVRSTTMLASSNKERRWPVKVLIYGQSIVGSRFFTEMGDSTFKAKFPFADVTVVNKAIGGFGGERIIRTAIHDVYPYYPDLIVFHVYGGEKMGELEELFGNIKKYTTADVIIMGHHVNGDQKMPSEASAKYLRYIANKYDCEFVDIAVEWPRYLAENKLQAKELLRDNVHPNREGNWLLWQLIARHIQYSPIFPSDWINRVQTYYTRKAFDKGVESAVSFEGKPWEFNNNVAIGDKGAGKMKFRFTGNRVDVITPNMLKLEKTGSARIILDGKPMEQHNELYAITLPGKGLNTWWPAIMRISSVKPLIAETWVLKITGVSKDSSVYNFSVTGSKTGLDGTGNTAEAFISKSGRVVIDPKDFMFNDIKKTFKTPTPVGFEVTWEVVPQFLSVYQPEVATDRAKLYKTTLAQGLSNGPHTIEIIPVGDGPVPIESFEVHKPQMQ